MKSTGKSCASRILKFETHVRTFRGGNSHLINQLVCLSLESPRRDRCNVSRSGQSGSDDSSLIDRLTRRGTVMQLFYLQLQSRRYGTRKVARGILAVARSGTTAKPLAARSTSRVRRSAIGDRASPAIAGEHALYVCTCPLLPIHTRFEGTEADSSRACSARRGKGWCARRGETCARARSLAGNLKMANDR